MGETWVVLGGANGSSNLGDQSMWEAAVSALRRARGEVSVVTDGPAGWQPDLPAVQALPFLHFDLRRGRHVPLRILARAVSRYARNAYAINKVRSSRHFGNSPGAQAWQAVTQRSAGVIIAGSGAINDDYAVHGVASWLVYAEWCRQYGKPFVLIGQGIGPLRSAATKAAAAKLLNSADHLGVRDEASARVCEDLAVKRYVTVTPDWALANVPSAADHIAATSTLSSIGIGSSKFVALTLHRRFNASRSDLRVLASLYEHLASRCAAEGKALLFVPNMRGAGYTDDRRTSDTLMRQWKGLAPGEVHVVREALTPGQTRALLGRAQGLVTTRYHSMVFALAEGIPSVGLVYDSYYDQKLGGVSTCFGMQDNLVRVTSPQAPKLIEAIVSGQIAAPTIVPRVLDIVGPFESYLRSSAPSSEIDGPSAGEI